MIDNLARDELERVELEQAVKDRKKASDKAG